MPTVYPNPAATAGQSAPVGQSAPSSSATPSGYPGYGQYGASGSSSGETPSGAPGQPGPPLDPEVAANRQKIEELTKVRTWTDITGQFKFEGKFLDYTSGKVSLQRSATGQNTQLDMSRLSAPDQEFIREGLKAQAREKKREEQIRVRNLRRPQQGGTTPYSN
jgi:hypothetical protein